ncbi:hypothetical protein [Subtercola sp. RTI3]|uniref:hypothetical protein n=1 Tax=Subtercola sp. RTI3 TaxID=3048639 RepID=UPI002B229A5C|nr:hypothetical protein [Subtercola sp. RTI3]MEA9987066.1 hypothetical protein [Subtercola sp. RTI3]
MSFHWNSNADQILAQMVANTAAAIYEVCRDFSGRPVDEVRPALAARWAASNEGASITEPELTNVATLISQGKRVWAEADGRIMAHD